MSGSPHRAPGKDTNTPEDSGNPHTFVAIGDSFTEGLADAGHESFRGWADRLAESLTHASPGLHYANLAVRGKLLEQVVDEQVPMAAELHPDLVAFTAGGNDILRPFSDPDALARRFEQAVTELRARGAQVLISTGFDTRQAPLMRHMRGKVGMYNSHLWAIGRRHGCHVADLWSMRTLQDPRAWNEDRLHLSSEGHRRVALCAAEVLGLEVEGDWREPWPPETGKPWHSRRAEDIRWAREYLAPWIGRRLRGESSGDGRGPKRPQPGPVGPVDASSR